MPFPVTLATREIHADIRDAAGNPAAGAIAYVNPYALYDEVGNLVLSPGAYAAELVAGEATIAVPATDAPDTLPVGRTIVVRITTSSFQSRYEIQVPADGAPAVLELSDILPAENPVSPAFYATVEELAATDATLAATNTELASVGVSLNNTILTLNSTIAELAETNAELDTLSQAVLSTGITWGGQLNINVDPSKVDITAMQGYVVDYITDPDTPTITSVNTPDKTVAMNAGALSRSITWWLHDSSGNVIQQADRPRADQRRTHIMLGFTTQTGGSIIDAQSMPVILRGPDSQMVDLIEALGAFNVSGNEITPNGANLQINQATGRIFSRSFTHYVNDLLTNSPHLSDTTAQAPAMFTRITQTTTVLPALTNLIDAANYDLNGVVTPTGGGPNAATIHRVFLFPSGDPQRQLIVQYGQKTYTSLANAVAAIGGEAFTANPTFVRGLGAMVAHIAVVNTATNLSDSTQAVFHLVGRFNYS